MSRRLILLLFLYALPPGIFAWSQEAARIGLSIAEVNRVLTTPTETAERLVTFRGVVNHVAPRSRVITMQEGAAGVCVNLPPEASLAALGDEVEVVTTIRFRSTHPDTVVNATFVQALGRAPAIDRVLCKLGDVIAGRYNRRAVEVEAVVLQVVHFDDLWWLHLADDEGWSMARIYDWPQGWDGREWIGARIRFRGIDAGSGPRALRCSTPGDIEILRPGSSDPFAAPSASAAQLRESPSTGNRAKLTATVLGVVGDQLYLRQGSTAFRADCLSPFEQLPATFLQTPAPAVPVLRGGERIEIVGSPRPRNGRLQLRYSSARILATDEAAAAREIEPAALLDGRALFDLVRVSGRLVARDSIDRNPGWSEVLHLEVPEGKFRAVLDSSQGQQLDALKVGDRLEVTGLVVPADHSANGMVRLLRAADVHTLGLDPALGRQRLLRIFGVAVALAGLAAAWIVLLRRQVRERTAALAAEVEERKRAQAELDRALASERELGELKSRFVSLVSHEFRTPLGITMSAVELLRHYAERLSRDKLDELLADIHGATLRMSGMMEQVLLLGRVEAGKMAFNATPLDLFALGEKLADEVRSATQGHCPIALHTEGDLLGARGDEGLIRHVFSNLLSNAVKYSPEGSPVEFQIRRESSTALFIVRDHGLGIPAADQPRLFEAFHRAGNVGEIPGTGLGLLIVKRCVEMHHGTIAFESGEREGTTFTIRLPLFSEAGL